MNTEKLKQEIMSLLDRSPKVFVQIVHRELKLCVGLLEGGERTTHLLDESQSRDMKSAIPEPHEAN